MSKIIVNGGKKLKGEIQIEGAKNAVLPILAAAILNEGVSVIKKCPKLRDVELTIEILKKLGCKVNVENDTVTIDSSNINNTEIPESLAAEMRSSIIFIGPMLARFKKVTISYPGGCAIGPRPIDIHLKALRQMGIIVDDNSGGYIYSTVDNIKGCEIQLDFPSVGATENVMIAAVVADGEVIIRNVAKEPEIVDLQAFLRKLGAEITGAGSSTIRIKGGLKKINTFIEHEIIPDRIVAGTYMVASAITGGDIIIQNIIPEHLYSTISLLKDAGCHVNVKRNALHIRGPVKLNELELIRTLPYPGFPTDMQSQFVSMLTVANGTSVVVETVFENRFWHIEELRKMGANIRQNGRVVVIKGVEHLKGSNVFAKDLRGGAALVLAGLAASDETIINGVKHINRGYENIVQKLLNVGADIKMV